MLKCYQWTQSTENTVWKWQSLTCN